MSYENQSSRDVFPFLSLPPDIRLEIYSALLGGKTLRFNDYFFELGNRGIFLCRASVPDNALFHDGEVQKVAKFGPSEVHKSLQARHSACYANWEGLQVQFLRVCELIYREASLVPFKENAFVFPSPQMAAHLIERLAPWQAAAIEKVTLHQQRHWRYWAKPYLNSKYPLCFAPLPGLRHVRIIIELNFNNLPTLPADWANEVDQDKMIAAMADFTSKKLSKVEIAIVDMTWNAPLHWRVLTEKQLAGWASRIRRLLDKGKSELNRDPRLDWASVG